MVAQIRQLKVKE